MTRTRTFAILHGQFFPKAQTKRSDKPRGERPESRERSAPRAPPKIPSPKNTSHRRQTPVSHWLKKGPTRRRPHQLDTHSENSTSCSKGRPEMEQQVSLANGELLHARLALKENRAK
ncbi:hypothetical protein AVEN_13880-1 [Araneus ventricosus]|uniref:Uncharacterized protein n=1 Tax=Araneus ventricosus TaxID=182803 RepID=A0A4Y2M7N2_ARAVE|nr:hypothetical protein AVEN_13880-1 [Araneus ventricosus]